tara:strand:+ start:1126 stop:1272 length:147 start_codon:yes stop_codon:yes gene_type:complete
MELLLAMIIGGSFGWSFVRSLENKSTASAVITLVGFIAWLVFFFSVVS